MAGTSVLVSRLYNSKCFSTHVRTPINSWYLVAGADAETLSNVGNFLTTARQSSFAAIARASVQVSIPATTVASTTGPPGHTQVAQRREREREMKPKTICLFPLPLLLLQNLPERIRKESRGRGRISDKGTICHG